MQQHAHETQACSQLFCIVKPELYKWLQLRSKVCSALTRRSTVGTSLLQNFACMQAAQLQPLDATVLWERTEGGCSRRPVSLSSGLHFVVLELSHWKCITRIKNWVKIGAKWKKIDWISPPTPPNKLDFTFGNPNHCAKFYQNQTNIVAVGVRADKQIDRQTLVL